MADSQLLARTARTGHHASVANHYSLLVAGSADEVLAAQRLRHRVFAGELGATLHSTADVADVDADSFDEYCDHLVVREDATGEIVGTYRMLPPDRAAAAGRLYSDGEFDLGALAEIRPSLVETGRSCVHADHRNGAVIGLIWAGIARYMYLCGHAYLAGCASVPLADGAAVWREVAKANLAPEHLRVRPHLGLDPDALAGDGAGANDDAAPKKAPIPPLVRGYLRLGAWVCGPPAVDADFGVADFFVLLPMDRVDQRYLRFFLGSTESADADPGGAECADPDKQVGGTIIGGAR